MTAKVGAKQAVRSNTVFIDFKFPILFTYDFCTSYFMATEPEPAVYVALVSENPLEVFLNRFILHA